MPPGWAHREGARVGSFGRTSSAASQGREEPAQEHAETAPSPRLSSRWSNPSERLSARPLVEKDVRQSNFREA